MTVADAGVLAEAAGRTDDAGRRARTVFEQRVAVPDVVFIEAYSVLRRQHLRGELTDGRFEFGMVYLRTVPAEVHPARALLPRMSDLVHSVSAYDAAYVALAEVLGVPLLTTDARLAAAHGPRCEIRVLD